MKNILFTAMAALLALPAFAGERALDVSISGIGPAVDAASYSKVLQITGKLVARGNIEKYIVHGYGIEGGSFFCIELNRFEDDAKLAEIEALYSAIRPPVSTTSYNLQRIESCK